MTVTGVNREAKPKEAGNYPHVAEMRTRFANYGIDTGDSSVFSYADPEGFKFIRHNNHEFLSL